MKCNRQEEVFFSGDLNGIRKWRELNKKNPAQINKLGFSRYTGKQF